ncbi:MAG TPA: extracellular solute-binding protein [Vicinamibacteria bacterium]|nr:extracellular solute-binding protein [Vicinamibacteria bacterium]
MRRHLTSRTLGLGSLAVYSFLYAPLAVLAAFSFNRGRLTSAWEGFTLQWYAKLLADTAVLRSLRNSLIVALAATVLSTVAGTAAALALHRHRFRRQASFRALVTLPIVVPEIVMASSLLLLFAALGIRLGFASVIFAHVAFSVSYVVLVVRARLAGLNRALEEAAMDLGASPGRTFFMVTLPNIAPGVLAAALLVFALSIDDYVITSFVAGVGSTTLPIQVYSMVRSGVSPEINAVSTVLLTATALILLASWWIEHGVRLWKAAIPAAAGLGILALPFALVPPRPDSDKILNVYIWSNYIAPETLKKFEDRYGARVNVDLYDSVEALLAKVQAGNIDYDVLCPTNYGVEILKKQNLLLPLDHSALPNLVNLDPRFLDPEYDPGNRYSVPYFWGTAGIAYRKSRVGLVESWESLWDERYAERILMLDDPRETFGAALKWRGFSLNTTDEATLRMAQELLLRQKRLVKAYDSANFQDVLLAGDVWIAHGWNGQFARVMDIDPDIAYVIPEEGGSLFIDSLVIPSSARNPELAHAFIDFTLEAEIAAEICATMQYSSPNQAARRLLPEPVRTNPAIFPGDDVLERVELIHDIGQATLLYDRLWTEVKTAQ